MLLKGLHPNAVAFKLEYKDVANFTSWKHISPLEFYVSSKAKDNSSKWDEINSCCICMCELYPNILDSENLMADLITEQNSLRSEIG